MNRRKKERRSYLILYSLLYLLLRKGFGLHSYLLNIIPSGVTEFKKKKKEILPLPLPIVYIERERRRERRRRERRRRRRRRRRKKKKK